MRGFRILAASAGLLLSTQGATAADLGGNCCADLEERIAELEATTARKGNRKVSLEIYGQVNEAIGYWDDGVEQNVYQFTNDTSRTRFGFKGKAKIAGDWYAAFRIEVGIRTAPQQSLSATNDDGAVPGQLDLRHASWSIGSKTYGEVTVGETSFATDGIKQVQTAKIGHFANNDIFDFPSDFVIRNTNRDWETSVVNREPGEGSRGNLVRYDSPEFGGFTASAHWGEDDVWGMALRYKGEIGDFKVVGGIGYGDMTERDEECTQIAAGNGTDSDCQEYGGSVSVMHGTSGIFVTGAYGIREDEVIERRTGRSGENTHWLVQAGIEQKWIPLGSTTIFGGYQERETDGVLNDDGGANISITNNGAAAGNLLKTEVQMWEVGLNQHVSAAAMDLYLHYKHYEADLLTSGAGQLDTEDFQTVIGGAMIKF